MWSLQNTEQPDVFYMLSNTTYRVGKDCVVNNKQKISTPVGPIVRKKGRDDDSISRNHALFKLEHSMQNLHTPGVRPVITLTDTNSSYGTFMNTSIDKKVAMQKSHPFLVRDGFFIRFGLQWNKWKLQYQPHVVLLPSTMEENAKLKVKRNILKLGGHTVDYWSSDVTHFTVPVLKLTVKVVNALAKGIPIVTPDYWATMVTMIQKEQGTKLCEKSLKLPDAADFLPQVEESMLNGHEVSFAVNPARSQLFKDKCFVFVKNTELMNMRNAIESAGGKVTLWCNELNLEQMCEDNAIVINQILEDSLLPEKFNTLKDLLAGKNKRFVPSSEISLAILYNSIEKHCNPFFCPASLIRAKKDTQSQSQPGVVFAADTCDVDVKPVLRGRRAASKSTMKIPESMEVEEENPFVSAGRATRSKVASKESPVINKENSHKGCSVESANKPSPSISDTIRPSPIIEDTNTANESILTFNLDDKLYTMPKSLKQRRSENSDDLEPPSKNVRLETDDDSQDVVVRRGKLGSARIVDSQHSVEIVKEEDEEDLFGFQDTDISSIISNNKVNKNKTSEYIAPASYKTQSSLPSTSNTSNGDTGSSNKTFHKENMTRSNSRKRPNTEDKDEEKDAFEFKTIKLPKLSTAANESDFDFDDNLEIPSTATTTQSTQVKKKPSEINQAKKAVIKISQGENAVKQSQKNKTVSSVKPHTLQNEANDGWLDAIPKLENAKLEDEDCVDTVQVFCRTLIKPRPVPQTVNTNLSTSKNVKPFRKSWHPQNQQLPDMIARTELKSVEFVTGLEQVDPSIEAERQERLRQRELKWDFPERQQVKQKRK